MRKKNFKSDFFFIYRLFDRDDECPVDLSKCDFTITVRTSGYTRVVATHRLRTDGDVWVNCADAGSGAIRVICDNHGLSPGIVITELTANVPSDIYPDRMRTIVRKRRENIHLVDGEDDDDFPDLAPDPSGPADPGGSAGDDGYLSKDEANDMVDKIFD